MRMQCIIIVNIRISNGGCVMKRENKKTMLIFLEPDLKEMIRYQAYKEHRSQNSLIEIILKSYLENELSQDSNFRELAKI